MNGLDLGAIEKRVQERIDIVAESGGLVPLVEQDRLQLLNEVRRLRQERQEAEDSPCYCPMPHPRHHPPYQTDKRGQ